MLDTIFVIAAVVGGTVMVCQFVLTILGLGHDGADLAHDGGDFAGDAHIGDTLHGSANGDAQHPDSTHLFGILSFRTLIAAAAFFGASGKALLSAGYAPSTSLILALLIGLLGMYGMYWLLRLISSLDAAGNERISNALGRQATVYIPIPPSGRGAGKVQLSMQNRIVEYQAVTDDEVPLKTGESVEVVAIVGSDIVRVRREAQPVVA